MKQAVLKIYYKDKYLKLHSEAQGKFFYLEGKPIYLADMTPNKWWRNYSGYSISKQIIEAFEKLKLRPRIIYRLKDKGTLYEATQTKFKKKGILVAYGGHSQYVLPIKEWTAKQAVLTDPHQLPVMSVDDWVKSTESYIGMDFAGNEPVVIDLSVKKRLAEDFRARFK